jgi:hypothetical protein
MSEQKSLTDSLYIGELVGYVPIETWALFEGCTTNAIRVRVSKGIWQKGKHVVTPKGGKSMVNLKAAKQWLEGKGSSRVA